MQTQNILFFGCGTHREATMMSFIIGRNLLSEEGISATLSNYSLAVQSLSRTPDINISAGSNFITVRQILKRNWGESFQNYIAKPDRGSYIKGNIWQITKEELEFIRYWEFVEYGWYEEIDVVVKTANSDLVSCKTVCIRSDQEVDELVHPEQYDPWIQPPESYQAETYKSRISYITEKKNPSLKRITPIDS